MIGQLCLDAHLPERGNLYTHCARHKPEGNQESPLSILYLNIIILILIEIFICMNYAPFLLHTLCISVYSA